MKGWQSSSPVEVVLPFILISFFWINFPAPCQDSYFLCYNCAISQPKSKKHYLYHNLGLITTWTYNDGHQICPAAYKLLSESSNLSPASFFSRALPRISSLHLKATVGKSSYVGQTLAFRYHSWRRGRSQRSFVAPGKVGCSFQTPNHNYQIIHHFFIKFLSTWEAAASKYPMFGDFITRP